MVKSPSARAAALHALIALQKGKAERLRDALDRARLQGREQALAFELGHGVCRRERLLDHVLAGLAHRGLPTAPAVRAVLRLGAYQLLFMAGMPRHAAVGETVALVRSNRGFVNAILRKLADCVVDEPLPASDVDATTMLALGAGRHVRLPQPLPDDLAARLAVVHSLPDFLVERWRTAHGLDALPGIAAAATAVPPVWLRPTIGDVAALARRLQHQNVETAVGAADDLRWIGGASPFDTSAFAAGEFVVQDPTAYRAAQAVPCEPGATVLDLCAAPGTKTVQLARRVRPGGRVLAHDPDPGRRGRITENVARLQLEDTVELVDDPTELAFPVDATLADVPCSNTGVLGRRVEVRQRLTPAAITELEALQRELLTRAIACTRAGGHVVYSTCSIEPEENGEVVARVVADLAAAAEPRVVERLRAELTLPRAGECDGGYFAVLRV